MIRILVSAVPIVLLLSTMFYLVLTLPGETTLVRRGGGAPWISVPTWQVQAGFLALLLLPAAIFVRGLLLTLLDLTRAAHTPDDDKRGTRGLALGEAIAWKGRQGWRGLPIGRVALISLAGVGPIVFAIWVGSIWNSTDGMDMKLLWTFGALLIFGGSLAMVLITGPAALRRLWRDLFGTMVVTDRRIAWLSPVRGEVYREVGRAELISASLVDGSDGRGWIAIVRQTGEDVQEVDIKGLPQPRSALSALHRLLKR